jgi:ketosteroid isomerase-like protein
MTEPITIRHSTDADRVRVEELAELDGRPAPQGETLLAEVEGKLWVAVGIEDGAAVADPFELTRDVVWLLQMRAEQERAMAAPGPLVGRLMTVRQHAGAIA